jgi:hypothetical protein
MELSQLGRQIETETPADDAKVLSKTNDGTSAPARTALEFNVAETVEVLALLRCLLAYYSPLLSQ